MFFLTGWQLWRTGRHLYLPRERDPSAQACYSIKLWRDHSTIWVPSSSSRGRVSVKAQLPYCWKRMCFEQTEGWTSRPKDWVTSRFRPCKGIQDSLEFWIPRCRFRISGSGFQTLSLEFGFWISIVIGIRIPWAVFQIPKAKIPDSTSKRFPYSGIPYMRR